MAKVGVIGAGSWGTALAILLSDNKNDVILWSHREAEAEKIRRTRVTAKLPEITLPPQIRVTADLAEAVGDREVLILVVPSACVRETARKMQPYVAPGTVIVSASKEMCIRDRGTDRTDSDSGARMPHRVFYDERKRREISTGCFG